MNYSFIKDVYNLPNPTLKLKWSSKQYTNAQDPEVWGAAFWFSIHNGCVTYPLKASKIVAERMKGFILGLPYIIPCQTCAEHARAHIENTYHRLDLICSSRNNLFNFFVDFHNYVNKRYNKPEISYSDAWAMYTGTVSVSKLTY